MGPITIVSCIIQSLLLSTTFLVSNAQTSANDAAINDVFNDPDPLDGSTEQTSSHPVTHILKAFIQEEEQPIIKLRWKKTEQLVLNHHLPVWGAQCGDIHDSKKKDAGEILKHFFMFQDPEHDSAIVLVTSKNLIFGNVGTKYHIHDLPLEVLLKKTVLKVGGLYVTKNPDTESAKISATTPPAQQNPVADIVDHTNQDLPNEISPIASRKRREDKHVAFPESKEGSVGEKYYIETLLFITHDIVEPMKLTHPGDYLFYLLLHYAVCFNSMDMLLAKLPTKFRVYVNIAGIIFEEDPDVFSSVIKSSILDYAERNESLVLEGFARLFSNYYLLDPDFVMRENTFDLVFISTGRELEYEEVKVFGQSFGGIDLYTIRKMRTHQMIGIPKSIVTNTDVYTNFAIAAHEIGNVFAYHNPDAEHCVEEYQTQLPVCDHCLEWSPDTVSGIVKFMRENQNRCWLLNHPWSLRPHDVPAISQSPTEQCQCYGYDVYGKKNDLARKNVPYNACVRALSCVRVEKENHVVESTILPFDGTPCQKDGNKVCWRQKCVKVNHQKKITKTHMYGWKSYSP